MAEGHRAIVVAVQFALVDCYTHWGENVLLKS